MLAAIRIMMKSFNFGYGDKEMYWIAATAAEEDYGFEPFVAGGLGDCGALVHFDPTSSTAETAVPWYINAEYLVDLNKLKNPGDFLDLDGKALLITKPMVMNEKTSKILILKEWTNQKHGFYPCGACAAFGCDIAKPIIPAEIRKRQEIILKLALRRSNAELSGESVSQVEGEVYKSIESKLSS